LARVCSIFGPSNYLCLFVGADFVDAPSVSVGFVLNKAIQHIVINSF
jgi:hypothetical protein